MLSAYQQYIHLSKYARWLDHEQRRETWHETVARWLRYFDQHVTTLTGEPSLLASTGVAEAITNMQVMPSMRALMTAGPALDRDHVAGYNCSYLAVDHQHAFDEALYVLMCGTGVGYTVERQVIAQLPPVPAKLEPTDYVIDVADSRIGWATALRELIGALYDGKVPQWSTYRVRPAGSRLHTFGGRASGPEPLISVFKHTVATFKGAAGRKLNSLECHDLMCKIAECVVAGGVRRSAMLSLSNLSDERMRDCKSGEWWHVAPYRAMANNSVAYTETPEIGRFMREWLALYEAKSGERGIFNRAGVKRRMLNTRRDAEHEFGVNPCVTGDTWVLTSDGSRQVKDLIDTPFTAIVDGRPYRATGFWLSGEKEVYKLTTNHGYTLKATKDHKILCRGDEWVTMGDLTTDHYVMINDNSELPLDQNEPQRQAGWLLGQIVGNGGYNPDKYAAYVRFWGDDRQQKLEYALQCAKGSGYYNYDAPVPANGHCNGTYGNYASIALDDLCNGLIEKFSKDPLPALEQQSDSFIRGYLQGYFDADGSPQGSTKNGRSIRLSSNSLNKLYSVQRMLVRFGIPCKVYENRKLAGKKPMPDGYGGKKEYHTKAMHELLISNYAIVQFADKIGFIETSKATRLAELICSSARPIYAAKYFTKVVSVEPCGTEPVYDCTVENVHRFDANGILAANCGEIELRPQQFCNLSSVVIRAEDTEATLAHKVRLATIIGTVQSTLTDFRYLRPEWQQNCNEERLLGVSLSGIMDHPVLRTTSRDAIMLLEYLRGIARETNRRWSSLLGIAPSAAITCVKPEGNSSQLVNSASGIHPRHSPYYIRRVRQNVHDPLTRFMIDSGIPHAADYTNPNTMVFEFAVASPPGAVCRDDRTALQQLEHWLMFREHWCEHNPSITVTVREHEWLEAGAWVYKHFDQMSGVSFLPHSDHTYQQAPYEAITEAEYRELASKTPKIDWQYLAEYETTENTTTGNEHEFACTGGACEIR